MRPSSLGPSGGRGGATEKSGADKPQPREPRGTGAPRPKPIPAKLRQLVWDRAGGACDRCGRPITGEHSVHHRLPRRAGGRQDAHTAANCVLLCGSGTTLCHGRVESHRAEAYTQGFLIHDGVQRPEDVPILRHGAEWVHPRAEGWTPAQPLGSEEAA